MPLPFADKIVLDMPCSPLPGQSWLGNPTYAHDWSPYRARIAFSNGWNLTNEREAFAGYKTMRIFQPHFGADAYSEKWNLAGAAFTIESYVNLREDWGGYLYGTLIMKRPSGGDFDWGLWHNGVTKKWVFTWGDSGHARRDLPVATAYSLDTFNHVCAMSDGTNVNVYLNGVPQGAAVAISGNIRNRTAYGVEIGRYNGYVDSYLNAHVGFMRVVNGAAIYDMAGFTPPTLAGFDYSEALPQAALASSPAGRAHPLIAAGPSHGVAPGVAGSPRRVRDMEYGGTGMIVATVKERASPADLPVVRRVVLHRHRDNIPVAETWSDAAGNYAFTSIDMRERYYACAFDHTGDFRGVCADNLAPTAMALP